MYLSESLSVIDIQTYRYRAITSRPTKLRRFKMKDRPIQTPNVKNISSGQSLSHLQVYINIIPLYFKSKSKETRNLFL